MVEIISFVHILQGLSIFLLSYDQLIGDNFMVTMSNILFSLDMYWNPTKRRSSTAFRLTRLQSLTIDYRYVFKMKEGFTLKLLDDLIESNNNY